MKNKTQKVKIVKDVEKPIPVEIMEKAIVDISVAARKLKASRLSDRAVELLIYDSLPSAGKYQAGKVCGIVAVRAVLKAASELDKWYLK